MSVVRAAGVVLFHAPPGAEPRRFLVLRSARHGTWGFPKGHLRPGETVEECAARETAEETGGLAYTLVEGFRESITYRVPTPRPGVAPGPHVKEVVFFLGEAAASELSLSPEHDAHRWLAADEARARLTHDGTRRVLDRALARLGAR